MATEERLNEMENELRRTQRLVRWLLAVVVLCLVGWPLAWSLRTGAAVAQGPASAAGEFRARAFILVDGNGIARGRLSVLEGGATSLSLDDENGKTHFDLRVATTWTRLDLSDANGVSHVVLDDNGVCPRVELTNTARGGRIRMEVTGRSSSVGLGDGNIERVQLACDPLAYAWLDVRGANGKSGGQFAVLGDGVTVNLRDANGCTRLWTMVSDDGPALRMAYPGEPGERAGQIGMESVLERDGPHLVFRDGNGVRVWKAP